MPNERIKEEMILAGVTVSDLSDFIGKTEHETVDILNTELGIMQNYRIMLAVTEIVKRKERV